MSTLLLFPFCFYYRGQCCSTAIALPIPNIPNCKFQPFQRIQSTKPIQSLSLAQNFLLCTHPILMVWAFWISIKLSWCYFACPIFCYFKLFVCEKFLNYFKKFENFYITFKICYSLELLDLCMHFNCFQHLIRME